MKTKRQSIAILGMLLLLTTGLSSAVWAQAETLQTKKGTEAKVETVVDGLNHPWGMAFLPDGRLLIKERNTGNLYVLSADGKLSRPLEGLPQVYARGQGGLMDVVIDPEFERTALSI